MATSTFSYFEATRAYIERHGKPGAFYSDKASVFRNTNAGKTGNRVTHFGRAMYELNIDAFCANSVTQVSAALSRKRRASVRSRRAAPSSASVSTLRSPQNAIAYTYRC